MAEEYALTWGSDATQNDKFLGALAHGIPAFVPIVGAIGPLIVLLMFQEKSKFIRYHATQALIWQLALFVVSAVVIPIISVVTCGFGGLLYLFLPMALLVNLYGSYLAFTGQWQGFPGVERFGKY
jgi:uncharacterized membrane protein